MTEPKKGLEDQIKNEEKKMNVALTDEELEQAAGGNLFKDVYEIGKEALSCKKSFNSLICEFCKNYKSETVSDAESDIWCSSNHWKRRRISNL